MRINFNYQQTQAFTGLNPVVPAGEYLVKIVGEEDAPLKSGNGSALVFDYQILDGPFSGKNVSEWLNLNHTSEKARGVAQSKIKSIGDALGLANIVDTRELHNRPFKIKVSLVEYNGSQRNQIDGYATANAAPQYVAQTPQAVPQGSSQQSAPNQPYGASPWA